MVNTAEADDGPSCPGAAGTRALDRIASGRLRSASRSVMLRPGAQRPLGRHYAAPPPGLSAAHLARSALVKPSPNPVWRTLIGPRRWRMPGSALLAWLAVATCIWADACRRCALGRSAARRSSAWNPAHVLLLLRPASPFARFCRLPIKANLWSRVREHASGLRPRGAASPVMEGWRS
jgi:hypothetical protein